MMKEFKIEKGIARPREIKGEWRRLFLKMEVGDSILMSHAEKNNFYAALNYIMGKGLLASRKEGSLKRVWKLKELDKQS